MHIISQPLSKAMKIPTLAFFVSAFALAHSGVIGDAPLEVQPYSFVDDIIKAIFESLRPVLANLRLGDVSEKVESNVMSGHIDLRGINIKNADKFEIGNLKSSILPLRLTNLTLTWKDLSASAGYDIDLMMAPPQLKSPIKLFAKGDASAVLNDVFITIGANLDFKNKAIQIKPRGLFGFDVRVGKVDVSLSSLMGSTEFGSSLSRFLSKIIPELVDVLKKPVFNVFQDDVIRIINEFLKQNPKAFLLEDLDTPVDALLDTPDDFDAAFGHPLAFDDEELQDDQFNFSF